MCIRDRGSIEREDIHLETGTHGEVLAVTLALTLMLITGTERKLIIVYILGTQTIVELCIRDSCQPGRRWKDSGCPVCLRHHQMCIRDRHQGVLPGTYIGILSITDGLVYQHLGFFCISYREAAYGYICLLYTSRCV